MKFFLFLLFFIFSNNSFANLIGKGVLCNLDREGVRPFAFYFITETSYDYDEIRTNGDTYYIKSSWQKYYFDRDFIGVGDLYYNYLINRKTLELFSYKDEKKIGTCEVFNDHKNLKNKIIEIKDKYQQEHDRNSEKEENKL